MEERGQQPLERDVGRPAIGVAHEAGHVDPHAGHPAFGGEYRAQVYTPGNVHVVQGHIESWISNGGVPYPDPTGSGDTITLKQFHRC